MSSNPLIATRCRIHADKMQSEGWYVTANVLDEAAAEIERLARLVEELTRTLAY